MKRLFYLIVFAGFVFYTPLWAADTAQPSPVSEMFPETSFRFEPVVEGSEVVHDFVVRNPGTEALAILQVKTG